MPQSWLIGAEADCDLVVNRPGVSGHHCRLSQHEIDYEILDLNSTNGTFVNGERITREVRVTPADTITLGRSTPMPWPEESRGPVRELSLGREPGNDLVIDLPMVSGRHARVGWDGQAGQGWIEDLGSSNGTSVGQPGRTTGRQTFVASDTIFLGSQPITGAWLLARLGAWPTTPLRFPGTVMTLGRDPEGDGVFDAPQVSWRHARLTREGPALKIEDLGSSNGTFVNGRPVSGPTPLSDGDLIGLGTHTLILDSRPDSTIPSETRHATQVEPVASASGLTPIAARSVQTLESPALAEPFDESTTRPVGIWVAGLFGHAVLVALAIAATASLGRTGPETAASLDSWLALASVWFGLISASLYFLRPTTPELQRLGLAASVGVAQSLLAWLIVAPLTGLQAPWAASIALMVLASLTGLSAGFLIVVLVPRPSQAIATFAAALAVMFLFGALPSPLRPPGGASLIADAIPSRWTFEGLLLLESTAREPRSDVAQHAFPAASTRSGVRACIYALTFLLVGLSGAAAFIEWGPGARPSTFEPVPDAPPH